MTKGERRRRRRNIEIEEKERERDGNGVIYEAPSKLFLYLFFLPFLIFLCSFRKEKKMIYFIAILMSMRKCKIGSVAGWIADLDLIFLSQWFVCDDKKNKKGKVGPKN